VETNLVQSHEVFVKTENGLKTHTVHWASSSIHHLRFFRSLGLLHSLRLRWWQVLPSPVLINFGMELKLPHAYRAEGPRNARGKCELPYDLEGLREGVPHLVFERLFQRRNDRDRCKCDLDALWELLYE